MPLTDICEDECDEEWHALALEEWLACVTAIKQMAGARECPMNVACSSSLMEAKGAAISFMTLLECDIWLGVIICHGDVSALEEIRKAIERKWPGIGPDVRDSMLPELKACINHRVKKMGCAAVYSCLQWLLHTLHTLTRMSCMQEGRQIAQGHVSSTQRLH